VLRRLQTSTYRSYRVIIHTIIYLARAASSRAFPVNPPSTSARCPRLQFSCAWTASKTVSTFSSISALSFADHLNSNPAVKLRYSVVARSGACMAVDRLLLMLYITTGQRTLPRINASLLNCFFSTPVSRSTGMDRLGNVRNQQNADSLTRPSSQRSPPFP